MKVAIVIVPFIALMAFVEAARAQIGQPEWGVPNLQGLALLDDTRSSEINRTAAERQRFTIVLVRKEAVLLDTTTGETWRLVFADSENAPLRWQPIPRPQGTSAALPHCTKKRTDQGRTHARIGTQCRPHHAGCRQSTGD